MHCIQIDICDSKSCLCLWKSIRLERKPFFVFFIEVFIDHINKYCIGSQVLNWPCYKAVGYMFSLCFVDVFENLPFQNLRAFFLGTLQGNQIFGFIKHIIHIEEKCSLFYKNHMSKGKIIRWQKNYQRRYRTLKGIC